MCPKDTGAHTQLFYQTFDSMPNIFELHMIQVEKLKIKDKNYTNTKEIQGAQLHMLSNIPVRFHDSWSKTF
jgi:hypothetical protein